MILDTKTGEILSGNFVTHTFLLRERVTLAFSLPVDLTCMEARRLAIACRSFPLEFPGTSQLKGHKYHLRKGLVIEIRLPLDLKQKEADRLSYFVESLCF